MKRVELKNFWVQNLLVFQIVFLFTPPGTALSTSDSFSSMFNQDQLKKREPTDVTTSTYKLREEMVALNYQSNTTNVESNNKKQVTSTSSTLIRTIVFRPKVPLEVGGRLPIPIAQVIATEEDPSQNDPSPLLQAIHTNINREDLNNVISTVAEITEMNLVTNHQLLAQNAINNDNYIVTSN